MRLSLTHHRVLAEVAVLVLIIELAVQGAKRMLAPHARCAVYEAIAIAVRFAGEELHLCLGWEGFEICVQDHGTELVWELQRALVVRALYVAMRR